jgi:site-specific recombinase XerD
MDEKLIAHSQVMDWLRRSILEPHVSRYTAYLCDCRYAKQTQHSYLCAVAHFAHWLTLKKMSLSQLGDLTVTQFLSHHLPHCHCPDPVLRSAPEIRAALRHLLAVLRTHGVVRHPNGGSLSVELACFDRYMLQVRGLAANTRRQRVLILRRFLGRQPSGESVDVGKICSADIRDFVLPNHSPCNAGTVAVLGGALRCYLRFRALKGDEVQPLLDAVPRAAQWRLASLPEVLSEQEVHTLLHSFEKLPHSAKRAYAMVRCLIDLGLRAAEVVRLQLDDINWKEGKIDLPRGKSRRGEILPLPQATGQAIVDYLRTERPATTNRAVFVRHVAPYDQPIGPGVVQRAVREAYQRCGWAHSRVHILRHSLASRLLRQGAPLKEIADLLRHRSLDTATIYTKVDGRRLEAVALPWPGRQL